jgi:hypothetical protein
MNVCGVIEAGLAGRLAVFPVGEPAGEGQAKEQGQPRAPRQQNTALPNLGIQQVQYHANR